MYIKQRRRKGTRLSSQLDWLDLIQGDWRVADIASPLRVLSKASYLYIILSDYVF